MIKAPKKLIEVALPLDDINEAAAREKSIRHGHPSTLHLWWARRPLAAARAVLFAQMVNDPGGERGWQRFPGQTKEDAQHERERLFAILRDLVKWENTTNEVVLEKARAEIRKSWRETCALNPGVPGFDPEKLPAFHDPFAGGGSIPLEAQRLGLEAYASDLNPVAVLINKAMIEIPPKFAGRPPVNPESRLKDVGTQTWRGAQGLAEDVRYYGKWMRNEAFKRIGHLYPPVKAVKNPDATWRHANPSELQLSGFSPQPSSARVTELTVIAWIWARTVHSPNPAFRHVEVPLVKSFVLSSRGGQEAWLRPVVDGDSYRFEVCHGALPPGAEEGTMCRAGGTCVLSGTPIPFDYIREEGKAGRLGQRLIAIVCENPSVQGRIFLPGCPEHEQVAVSAQPVWRPTQKVPTPCHDVDRLPMYGMTTWGDAFTARQLAALTTFSDLVLKSREQAIADAESAGWADNDLALHAGGTGAVGYGDALAVYLAFVVDRVVDRHSSIATWDARPSKLQLRNTFARQAIPMTWDFGEGNPFCL
jgi:putative DNA methylase